MQFSFIFDMDGLILDTETIARKVWPIVYNFISEQEADDDYLHVVGKIQRCDHLVSLCQIS